MEHWFLFLTAGIFSCSKIAVDGQDYDDTVITHAQSKSIFRGQDLPNNTQISISLIENDKVKFEVEQGRKGLNAVRVEIADQLSFYHEKPLAIMAFSLPFQTLATMCST